MRFEPKRTWEWDDGAGLGSTEDKAVFHEMINDGRLANPQLELMSEVKRTDREFSSLPVGKLERDSGGRR